MGGRSAFGALLLCLAPAALPAQRWNDTTTVRLVHRAIMRRTAAQGDSGLTDFRADAHGFVFFFGQLGEGLNAPPRLIKADQLALQVYWKAPGLSKQRIIGWRDKLELPTDIRYHRDHLGIVMNGFGNRIRIGEGDEVSDVPHPLAPDGPRWYDYALSDSLSIAIPQRTVRVFEILVRPKRFDAPGIVGAMYIDAGAAELVRMRFQFTPAAYLDPSLEDITVVLDNGLWDGRYWLPRRQEIEIRRRTTTLDLPARGIIRGRWEIGNYAFNVGLPTSLFRGVEIVAAPPAERRRFEWSEPLDHAIADEEGNGPWNLAEVRGAIADLARGQVMTRLPVIRPGASGASDLVHVNRVEGLAVGFGGVLRPGGALELRAWGSYGFSDDRPKGRLVLTRSWGGLTVRARAAREVRDVGDVPLISPLFNSISAQELGRDFGDYVLADRVTLAVQRRAGEVMITTEGGWERTQNLSVQIAPVRGTFRPNPALGAGSYGVLRVTVARRGWVIPAMSNLDIQATMEGGLGRAGASYLRTRGDAQADLPIGGSVLRFTSWAGWGSRELPPDRALVWGGRGAPGCPATVRCGGRLGASAQVEWRLSVPAPAIALGPFVSTGNRAVVAPILAAAWLSHPVSGAPWEPTDGPMPVLGLALECIHQLLRFELAWNPRARRFGVIGDVSRSLWQLM